MRPFEEFKVRLNMRNKNIYIILQEKKGNKKWTKKSIDKFYGKLVWSFDFVKKFSMETANIFV